MSNDQNQESHDEHHSIITVHVYKKDPSFADESHLAIRVGQLWNSIIKGAIRIDQATEARTINETSNDITKEKLLNS